MATKKQEAVGLPKSPGRPKGSANKTTALLKEAIIAAAEDVGEDGNGKAQLRGYCRFLARSEPRAFAGLLGKVLPLQVTGLDDKDGNPQAITIHVIDAHPKR